MPGFNGRGPEGEGPKTGRGLGRCKPSNKENLKKNEDLQEMEFPEKGSEMGKRRGVKACGEGRGGNRGRGLGRGQNR